MTQNEKRVAVAKAMGVECSRCHWTGKYYRYGAHEWARINSYKSAPQPAVECDHVTPDDYLSFERLLPDYPNDRAAIFEAAKTLTKAEKTVFAEYIASKLDRQYPAHGGYYEGEIEIDWLDIADLILAPTEILCDAFLVAKGLLPRW